MNTTNRNAIGSLIVLVLVGLTGCAGMSERDRHTAIGAAIGGVGGAALTNGSVLGTVGGAAVGGVIGHEVGDRRR